MIPHARIAQRSRGTTIGSRTLSVVAALSLALVVAPRSSPTFAQTPPVRTVERVDLARYTGEWIEVARFPNRFQQKCTGNVRASYQRRDDGRIDVINRCRTKDGETEAQGIARVVDPMSSAKLEVRFAPAALSFLPFVWGDYWVIGLASDYSWAVVGTPNRDYLWILSRQAAVSRGDYDAALATAQANGFDLTRLIRTLP
jgi:apolipoprotein D and lipocalin family protein